MELLKTHIRHVPDFPKPGILFYDVTTLLKDPQGFKLAIDSMSEPYRGSGVTLVVGIESRGFILGSAVADRIGAGFVPVRKLGKLPAQTVRASYDLEYGSDSLEMHRDAIEKGQKVLIVDDLLATGHVPDRAGGVERPREAPGREGPGGAAVLSRQLPVASSRWRRAHRHWKLVT
ncbi:MAG: adenine phosphoribosyltransferase [Acidobacteria bacterium]|nr:MAG: adenine phosphoribosyltransferase [Acidobacteriota bacterium]